MKRSLGSTDSFGALVSTIATSEEKHGSPMNSSGGGHLYGMLEEEDGGVGGGGGEEYSAGGCGGSGGLGEKKRRLSVVQVKALEKNFEVENKLEPERKVKLAQELGLQPRQVAVWFQNRRARWKTKQLERDYGVLKANYDSLKLNYDSLKLNNESLVKQIRDLKSKLAADGDDDEIHAAGDEIAEEEEDRDDDVNLHPAEIVQELTNSYEEEEEEEEEAPPLIFSRDGSSDSDSSAILNDEYNYGYACPPPPPAFTAAKPYNQTQLLVKVEEHNFFGSEDQEAACNFFSDEQAPSLNWWN